MLICLSELALDLFRHSDELPTRRPVGGAPFDVRPLLDCSVVLFSFTGGDGEFIIRHRENGAPPGVRPLLDCSEMFVGR